MATDLERTPHVGYILEPPYPSFAVNEVLAVRRQGIRVSVLNSFRPFSQVEPAAETLRQESHYFPARYHGVGGALARALGRRPLSFARVAAFVARHRLLPHLPILAATYARLVEREKIDHLHGMYGTTPATLAMLTSWLTGRAYSFTCHAYDVFLPNPLLPERLRHASFMTTVTEFNRRHLLSTHTGLEAAKIQVVHLGVDPETWRPAAPPRPRSSEIVSVGNLYPYKGHGQLLRACALLLDRGFRFHCQIVGEGPQRPELEAQIPSLALEGSVALRGALTQAEVRPLLADAGVFVLACMVDEQSNHDGLPVALMEAMAMELPVVSTRLSGIPELVQDGVCGLLVPEKDPGALADAVAAVLQDPALAARLGAAARARVESAFTLDQSAARMADLFRRATAGG